jgi:hypothetical protein
MKDLREHQRDAHAYDLSVLPRGQKSPAKPTQSFSPSQAILPPTRLAQPEDSYRGETWGEAPRTLPGGTQTITRAPVPRHGGGGAKSPARWSSWAPYRRPARDRQCCVNIAAMGDSTSRPDAPVPTHQFFRMSLHWESA